jgi:aquaporin Z
MNKYVAEFIGTFFLVLTIGCTVIGHGAGPLAPLAIGSALMVMIFAGGHISGGHFNPAVTPGVWLCGKCEAKDVAPYMTFQIMGAVLAAAVVNFLKAGPAVTPLQPATVPALLAESLFTFALVYVVLNVATAKGTSAIPSMAWRSDSRYWWATGAFINPCNVTALCYSSLAQLCK